MSIFIPRDDFHFIQPSASSTKIQSPSQSMQRWILPFIIIFLLNGFVSKCLGNEDISRVLEMTGPITYVALSPFPLTLRYRVQSSDSNFPESSFTSLIFLQLSFWEEDEEDEEVGDGTSTIGTESLVRSKEILMTSQWTQISFECGLIVRSGYYHIQLIDMTEQETSGEPVSLLLSNTSSISSHFYISSYNGLPTDILNTIRIKTEYPTIDFDIPSRLQAYTSNVIINLGFSRSLCPTPLLLSLPSTLLQLTRNPEFQKQPETKTSTQYHHYYQHHHHHHTPMVTLMENPLDILQREGRITLPVECHHWSRNETYRFEIQETHRKHKILAKSGFVKVDWSWKFGVDIAKASVVPCRRNIRVSLSYPDCVRSGKDRIRVYGYETLPIPSALAPRRQSYITERQIQTNGSDGKILLFPCALFPQRFTKYCFQYVNIAEDESVAVVTEKCLPTFPLEKFTDGDWGSWSAWSECSVSCGLYGKQFRYRFCDSPQPSFGGNFCQGSSIEEKACGGGSGIIEESMGNTYPPIPSCPPSQQTFSVSSNSSTTKTTMTNNPDSPEVEFPRPHPHPPNWREDNGSEEDESSFSIISNSSESHLGSHINSHRTPGCECGCILRDLVPGFNYTLIISLTTNHTICEDEDEEEHHNLRWILHAREVRDQIRFQVMISSASCVLLSFRDGNTSDSNLLHVFRSGWSNRIVPILSTGSALSIGVTDQIDGNCSNGQSSKRNSFLELYGVYDIIPSPSPEGEDPFLSWKEFWTFLLLKLSLLLFLLVACVSLVSGCAKKVYDYKELKWSRTEDGDEEDCGGGTDYLTTSRTTSVTLMSFDHAYFRRLRLKNFLLKPQKLGFSTSGMTAVKSLPNTPNRKRKRTKFLAKERERSSSSGDHGGDENILLKSISLSDTNLGRHRPTTAQHVARVVSNVSRPSNSRLMESNPSTTQLTPKVRDRRRLIGREDSTSYTASDVNSLNDLEMDYYDYDIQNAGNIPGSYLLEPSFLFWTDPMMLDQSASDQGIELLNTSTSMCTSSSLGLFTPEPPLHYTGKEDFDVKETSFDTLDGYHRDHLKFVDDDDDEDRTISESNGRITPYLKR